ncbi:MAG TPA: NAD(P)/FAD-dependent oxidoreductase [Anaerolineales bacterium]|nr:NAD(P)/FAD-dependent oxidoreductase [Anaerolineales bacterium]
MDYDNKTAQAAVSPRSVPHSGTDGDATRSLVTEYDVIIIGGGPSGLSTALHLLKTASPLSTRILLLEKERYPRPKLCAGGLTLDAEILLERLGLNLNEVPHVFADDIHFDFESKGLIVRVPKRHALRVIRRDEFDNWLAKKAETRGLEIREGITVKNIIPHKDGVTIETDQETFCAQVIVGADGSNGVTRRCIFPRAPVYTARVLEVITPEYNVVASLREAISSMSKEIASGKDTPRNDKTAYFDFFPVPDNIAGYVWDFPTQVGGVPMRCWGIYDTNMLASGKRPQLKEALATEMSRLGFDLNQYEIKGHPIRWFSPENEMSVPRVLLVGDAVGADPVFGEGISIALGYGAIAAQEVSESLQRREFSFRGYRSRVLRSALGQTLIARWMIASIIYPIKWRWFQMLLWRFLKPIVMLVAWLFVLNWGKRIH